MRKTLFIIFICIMLLCGCNTKNESKVANYEQIEKEIKENLNKIYEISDRTSSSPYDYINNDYYNNIVNLGTDAIPILEKMISSEDSASLNAYILTLAIQDINSKEQ